MKTEPVRLGFWKTLSATTAMAVLATTSGLWLASFSAYRQELSELESAAATLAGLIESAAQFDLRSDMALGPQLAREATLRQVAQGLAGQVDRAGAAELVIGRIASGKVQLLRPTVDRGFEVVTQVAFDAAAGWPMREALAGRTGSGEFDDYRGVPVLAAYAPVPALGLGIVYKLDRSEARAPYRWATGWASAAYLFMVGLLAIGYWRQTGRMAHRIERSEQRFTAVFHTAPVIMVVLSPEGVIEEVNPFFEQLMGWSLDELRGHEWFSRCLPARDRDPIRALFKSALHGARANGHINPVLTRDGEERQIEWNNQTLRDSAGNISGMLAVGIDVTERLLTSAALQASEMRTRQVLDGLYGFVGLYTLDGTLIDANEAPLRAAGLQRADVLGHPFWDTYWWNYDAQVQAELRSALARAAVGETVRYEPLVRVLGGAFIDLDVTFGPLRDQAGAITHILGFGVDITERKRAERGLRRSEEEYRALFEQAAVGLVTGTPEGVFKRVNQRLCDLLGYTADEIRALGPASISHPDDRALDAQLFARLVAGEIPCYQIEKRYLHKRGWVVWVDLTLASRIENGEVVEIIGVVQDISERKAAEDLLLIGEERLRLALAAAGQGFYDIDFASGDVEVSADYATMLGEDPATFRVTSALWADRVHPDDRARVRALFDAYLRGETAHYEAEFRLRTRAGDWLWTLSIGRVVSRDARGRPLRMLGTHTNISARKQAQQALAENEALLSRIMDGTFDGILMADVETRRITFANAAICRMLGYTVSELLTKNVADLHPAESLPLVQQAFATIVSGQLPPVEEVKVLCQDGSTLPVEISGYGIEHNGRQYGVGVLRDVTAQRRAEFELRESEQRLRTIVESEPECVKLVDRDCTLLDMNPAGLRMIAADSIEQVRGSNVLDLVDPDYHQIYRDGVAAVFRGEPTQQVYEIIARDGQRRWMEQHAVPLWDTEKRGSVRQMLALTRDITERRRAQLALYDSEARLVEAQRIARLGSWELDLASNSLYWSDEIFRIFEIDSAQFAASYEAFLNTVHPDDREAVDAAYSGSLASRQPYRIVHRLRMGDGRIKHVEEQCETDFAADGRPLRSRGTVQDVTERVLTEQALRRSLLEKETLLREVHHRVKNNLQIVSSLLYFQGRKVTDSAAIAVFSEVRDRLRAMTLVHEKLYNSRDLSAVEFGDYVGVLAGQLMRSNTEASPHIRLTVDAAALTLPIELALPCGMILTELLTNVAKYAFPDGRQGEALVRLRVVDASVELLVRDDGVGLPADLDIDATASFGWRLIRNLTHQLGGALRIERANGLSVAVTFPQPMDHSEAS